MTNRSTIGAACWRPWVSTSEGGGRDIVGGYRDNKSYRAKTPEGRARQDANLMRGRKKKSVREAEWLGPRRRKPGLGKYKRYEIVKYIQDHFYTKENRDKPIKLIDWQKHVLTGIFNPPRPRDPQTGVYLRPKPLPKLAVCGSVKKSGKSALAASVCQYYLTEVPGSEIYILAPDREAGQLIIFSSLEWSLRRHPLLAKRCDFQTGVITHEDSFVRVLPCDLSISGLRPTLTVVDEAWQFRTPVAKKVLDEMTTNPVGDHLTLVVTYAGYSEDQTPELHLWRWYRRGKAIEAGDEPADDNFYFMWKEGYQGIPWVEHTDYLEHQQKTLAPGSYQRFHLNQWSSSENVFIDASVLSRCIDPSHRRGEAEGPVVAAVDVGLKYDCSALAAVSPVDDDRLGLIDHAIFKPEAGEEIVLEHTVERVLREWQGQYRIVTILYDPYQFARSAQTLASYDLNMCEYSQTVANMVAATDCLLGLLKSGKLRLYDDPDVKSHLLAAGVKEHQRGWRLIKLNQSRKIDIAVALAMACMAAVELLAGEAETVVVQAPDWWTDEAVETYF